MHIRIRETILEEYVCCQFSGLNSCCASTIAVPNCSLTAFGKLDSTGVVTDADIVLVLAFWKRGLLQQKKNQVQT